MFTIFGKIWPPPTELIEIGSRRWVEMRTFKSKKWWTSVLVIAHWTEDQCLSLHFLFVFLSVRQRVTSLSADGRCSIFFFFLLLGGGWVGVSDGKIKVLWAALCRTVRLIEAWLMMRRTQGKARTTTTKRSQSTKWGSCREFSKSCAIRPSPLNPWWVLFECFSAVQKRKVINRHEKEVSSTSSSRPHLESTTHPPADQV